MAFLLRDRLLQRKRSDFFAIDLSNRRSRAAGQKGLQTKSGEGQHNEANNHLCGGALGALAHGLKHSSEALLRLVEIEGARRKEGAQWRLPRSRPKTA